MLFNSLHYLIFFPIVAVLFFTVPVKWRTPLLLAASCYFYMVFKPIYILILVAVISIDYFSGIFIEGRTGVWRRVGLIVSIASNVGILFVFKYYNFALDNVAPLFRSWSAGSPVSDHLALVLPIGLSFHTFQSLAYVIEVFYGRFPAERHPLRFALYVLFFPQLVAGPIERPQGLLRQLHLTQAFSRADAVTGLRMILFGFSMKMLVADNLARYVDVIYADPPGASALSALLATLCFAFQIYGDFFGYSLIAIGSARVLGIRLVKNFDHPYSAESIADFWHRWHISLSTWFRDYVYIPLGGNRVPPVRRDLNLLGVFLLSGLWHGANWTFVVWGGLHGIYLLIERHLGPTVPGMPRLPIVVRRLWTFTLVSLAWVFFRARSVSDAVVLIRALTKWSGLGTETTVLLRRVSESGSVVNSVAVGLTAYVALGMLEPWVIGERPVAARSLRWSLYYAMLASLFVFARFDSRSFIYFQF